MNTAVEILGYVAAILGGGGLYKLITIRSDRKKMANQIAAEESSTMDEIVNRFNNRIAELSDRHTKIVERNMELETKVAQLEREKLGKP